MFVDQSADDRASLDSISIEINNLRQGFDGRYLYTLSRFERLRSTLSTVGRSCVVSIVQAIGERV